MKRLLPKPLAWIALISLAGAAGGVLIWRGTSRWRPEDRVYRIGWDADPPFQAAGPDGRATGLAIELVREAARRRGIRLEWVRQGGGADAALRDRKVDLWPLLTLVPERMRYIHITEPYLETEHCFLVRAESGFTERRDLAGALISFHDLRINRIHLNLALPGARLLATGGTDAAIESVCRRRADAAFVDEYTAISAMLGGLTCAGQELLLIATPEIQARMGVGSTFAASPAADTIRDEIGKIASEGELPPPLLHWSYFSRRHMESLQTLRNANRRQQLLTALAAVLFSALMIVGWLTHRARSERRRARSAEKELGTTQQNYQLLIEQAADGVFLAGEDEKFILMNSPMCEMLGYSDAEMRELTVLDTYVEDEREFGRQRLAGIACGTSLRFERLMRRNDGTAILVEASVVRLGDGRVQGIVRDITERKHAQEIENRLTSELTASRDEIRALAASLMRVQEDERRRVSRELHDQICNQLASLAVDIGKLTVGPLPAAENARAQLEAIRARVVKTSQEAHDIAYQMHATILDDLGLVASLKDLCSQFSEHHPDIALDFEDSGPTASIPGEVAFCLYRVAQESLQNIAKHSRAKCVSARLDFKKRAVVFTIQDDGAGFDPKAVKGRRGLGLISMQERAHSVNGTLTIKALQGKGAQIALEVPLPTEPPMKRPRVLLADDHPMVLEDIRSVIAANCEIVETVADGRALVEAALRLKPDLIVVDITMPLLNGIEAAVQIKKSLPGIKLLFVTMHASTAYVKAAFEAGGTGYVLKSGLRDELPDAVQSVLGGRTYVSPSLSTEYLERIPYGQNIHAARP